MVCNLTNQLHVLAFIRVQHGFPDGCDYFFFIKTDDAAVTFNYRLYHNYCI